MSSRDEGQFDAWAEAKDAVAGDFEIAFGRGVVEQIVFLPATDSLRGKVGKTRQQTHTVCPLTEIFLLSGESGRPKCASIWRQACSEEIERRAERGMGGQGAFWVICVS